MWYSSQVVRPRSATPLSAGSNPACTSKTKRTPARSVLFVLVAQVALCADLPPREAQGIRFTYPTRRSGSSLTRRRVWVSSPQANTRPYLLWHPVWECRFFFPLELHPFFELGSVHLGCNGVRFTFSPQSASSSLVSSKAKESSHFV